MDFTPVGAVGGCKTNRGNIYTARNDVCAAAPCAASAKRIEHRQGIVAAKRERGSVRDGNCAFCNKHPCGFIRTVQCKCVHFDSTVYNQCLQRAAVEGIACYRSDGLGKLYNGRVTLYIYQRAAYRYEFGVDFFHPAGASESPLPYRDPFEENFGIFQRNGFRGAVGNENFVDILLVIEKFIPDDRRFSFDDDDLHGAYLRREHTALPESEDR